MAVTQKDSRRNYCLTLQQASGQPKLSECTFKQAHKHMQVSSQTHTHRRMMIMTMKRKQQPMQESRPLVNYRVAQIPPHNPSPLRTPSDGAIFSAIPGCSQVADVSLASVTLIAGIDSARNQQLASATRGGSNQSDALLSRDRYAELMTIAAAATLSWACSSVVFAGWWFRLL